MSQVDRGQVGGVERHQGAGHLGGILEAVLGVQEQAPGEPGAAGGVREVSGGHSGGASTSDRS